MAGNQQMAWSVGPEVENDRSSDTLPVLADQHQTIKPRKYHWYASRYLCAITGVVVALLALAHVYRMWDRKRRLAQWANAGEVPRTHRSFMLVPTLSTAYRALSLASMPSWIYSPDKVSDAVFSGIYCCLLFVLAVNPTKLVNWDVSLKDFANQMGVMSFSQLSLIIILIMKNNPISLLTGITYQKLNFLHRAAGRACLLCSWLHALAWTPRVWEKSHFGRAYIIWGLLALFSFTMLWSTSLRIVRRAAWEFFLLAHILFTFLFLVGAILHWQKLAYWVWPALLAWLLDRLVRAFQLFRGTTVYGRGITANGPRRQLLSTIEIVAPELLKVTVPFPSLTWSAGQHAFLSFPSITGSVHEQHPFSFANVPTEHDNSAVFLVRVHCGATRRLYDALDDMNAVSIPVYVDGPYGSIHHFDTFKTVLIFAGGTGITFCLSHVLALIRARSQIITDRIRLVWHIRQVADASWTSPLWSSLINQLQTQDLNVQIDCYVTRSSSDLERASETTWLLSDDTTTSVKPAEGNQSRPHLCFNWHTGRATIQPIIQQEVDRAGGNLAVTTCGPQSLLRAVRKGLKAANADTVVYYEETLGA